MKQKIKVLLTGFLIVLLVLTGCAKEKPLIQRPEDGWYGQLEYQTVPYETIKTHIFDESRLLIALEELSTTLQSDGNKEQVLTLYKTIIEETDSLGTAMTLANIEYNADIQNKTAAEKSIALTEQYNNLLDKICPVLKNALASTYGDALEAEMLKVTTSDEIDKIKCYQGKSEDLLRLIRQEQELTQQYDITMQQEIEVEINGEIWTVQKLQTAPPSDVTEEYKINKALQNAKVDAIGKIFRELLDVRTQIAKAEGYDNYANYAYEELYNRDYTTKEIQKVYASVKEYFVPLYKQIQENSLKIDWNTLSQNKRISEEELLNTIGPYLEQIDPELKKSFEILRETHTYDMVNRKGKNNISFSTKIYSYGIPYLFLSPNGLVHDSSTLVHEFGHWNTMLHSKQPMLFEGKNHDVAEINSQGLELLFLDYADELWDDGADAFKYNTVMKICSSVIEGCLYDEFQNKLYENPNITTEEISNLYGKLCKEYGLSNKSAGEWIYVTHTFSFPLYYISYATSGLSSLDLYIESFENRAQAVNRYMALTSTGMTGSYRESIAQVGMIDIFKHNSIKHIAGSLRSVLDLE